MFLHVFSLKLYWTLSMAFTREPSVKDKILSQNDRPCLSGSARLYYASGIFCKPTSVSPSSFRNHFIFLISITPSYRSAVSVFRHRFPVMTPWCKRILSLSIAFHWRNGWRINNTENKCQRNDGLSLWLGDVFRDVSEVTGSVCD